MSNSAKAIANYFLDKAAESGDSLTPMKIQKLVYVAHGWYLALANENLIDEQIEAWQFGPVIRSLYDEFKQYGKGIIPGKAKTLHLDTSNGFSFRIETPEIPEDEQELRTYLDRVWESYRPYTAYQLSNMTHQEGTPWHTTWYKLGGSSQKGTDIPTTVITEYYKNQLEQRDSA